MRIVSITSVKDEGPFLLEWLAWHRLLGVSDFLIASNDCSDGTEALLQALQAAGIVTHLPQVPKPGQSIQWQALKLGWQHSLRKTADWLLVSDVDEFLMIHGSGGLAGLIAALPAGTEAMALGWRLFGAGGVARFEDRPVTGQFLRSAPEGMLHPVAATYFKTLFRPEAFRGVGVHRPQPKAGRVPLWVDGSAAPLLPEIAANPKRLSLLNQPPHRALAELHHYSLRSVESFLVKSRRGLPNRSEKPIDLGYWIERNFNAEENRAALPLQPALAAEIARLKALPGVGALHAAAVAHHRESFARIVTTPAGYRLFSQCLHAANSAVLPRGLALDLYRRFQDIGRDQPPTD